MELSMMGYGARVAIYHLREERCARGRKTMGVLDGGNVPRGIISGLRLDLQGIGRAVQVFQCQVKLRKNSLIRSNLLGIVGEHYEVGSPRHQFL